jgi:hypothetical protein
MHRYTNTAAAAGITSKTAHISLGNHLSCCCQQNEDHGLFMAVCRQQVAAVASPHNTLHCQSFPTLLLLLHLV